MEKGKLKGEAETPTHILLQRDHISIHEYICCVGMEENFYLHHQSLSLSPLSLSLSESENLK